MNYGLGNGTDVLQNAQDDLQTILQGVRVGVLVIGAELEIRLFNHAVLDLLDLTEEELHQSWHQCLATVFSQSKSSANVPAHHPVLRAIATQPSIQNAVIDFFPRGKHQQRWLLVNAVPQCHLDGRSQQVVCTFSEVTHLKQVEQALQTSEAENRALATLAEAKSQQLSQALQDLRQAQSRIVHQEKMSSLGRMVAGVAHEINNPVTFIYSNLTHANQYTQDLLELLQLFRSQFSLLPPAIQAKVDDIDLDFITDDLPRLFNSMKCGAERIRKIVASLRNFARLDEAEVKAVNLHEGIDSALMILGHRLKVSPNRPEIRVIKEYGDLPLVECYAGQMNQVFMNILSNAIDALEESLKLEVKSEELKVKNLSNSQLSTLHSPTITIRTEYVAALSCVSVRIADNGVGISEMARKNIFDPFFTTKPVGKGTGLGLFTSYQIVVERHGGSIQCFTQPQGTEFEIEIPIYQKQAKGEWPPTLETQAE